MTKINNISEYLTERGFTRKAVGPFRDKPAYYLGKDNETIIFSAGHLFRKLSDGYIYITRKEITDWKALDTVLQLLGYCEKEAYSMSSIAEMIYFKGIPNE